MNKTLKHTFLDGILYFFNIERNPISDYLDRLRKESDFERVSKDWFNIGNDIKNAYEKYKTYC